MEVLEAIISRSMVPILRLLEDKPPELVMALLPSLVRMMLAAFVGGGGGHAKRVGVIHPREEPQMKIAKVWAWVHGAMTNRTLSCGLLPIP